VGVLGSVHREVDQKNLNTRTARAVNTRARLPPFGLVDEIKEIHSEAISLLSLSTRSSTIQNLEISDKEMRTDSDGCKLLWKVLKSSRCSSESIARLESEIYIID
jgi:hypothetical protein